MRSPREYGVTLQLDDAQRRQMFLNRLEEIFKNVLSVVELGRGQVGGVPRDIRDN